MIRDRRLAGCVLLEAGCVDVQLCGDEAQEFVADLQGLLVREAAEQADEADLVGEPQAVVVAAALADLGEVGRGQGRLADQLSPREGEWRHGWHQSVQINARHFRRLLTTQ
jgi:hypothetical protein